MINYRSVGIFLLVVLGVCSFGFTRLSKEQTATDEEILIGLILHRGLLEEEKVADFNLFENTGKFYLSRRVWDKYFPDPETTAGYVDYPAERFPKKIGNAKIVALTDDELQERANKKGDFLHLQLSDIRIEGNRAEIGLSTSWVVSEKKRGKVYMSGGGYILEYVKVNGNWKFNKELRNWIS